MENTQLSDLKNRLEALLFSSGKPMQLEELSTITKEKDPKRIEEALLQLKKELDEKKSSIMLIQDGTEWKLTVREHYMPFVRKVVSQTELPKTILQTLAVVAHKAPALQSQVIKIRTNKAYRHLDFLEEKGYITREKKGRTKLIKLTQKFFEYFDISTEKLKEKFSGFKELEKAIEQKEEELEKKQGKTEVIDILETYDLQSEESTGAMKEMLGGLEIYKTQKPAKTPKKEALAEKEIKKVQKEAEALQEAIGEIKEEPARKEKTEKRQAEAPKKDAVTQILDEAKHKKMRKKEYTPKRLFSRGIPPEIQKKIDEKVKEMTEGEKEKNDADSDLPEMQEQDEISEQ